MRLPRAFSGPPAFLAASSLALLALALQAVSAAPQSPSPSRAPVARAHPAVEFSTADECMACHNGLRTPAGEDVSIGSSWRASMMANSSRDPYWQAAVRREVLDHPTARAAIEDECSVCHMPMARTAAHARGAEGEVFSHLPVRSQDDSDTRLAHDGVSCTICHQIADEKLGTPESFTGGYVVKGPGPAANGPIAIYGPFKIEKGLESVMHSSSRFTPTESLHIRQSELCATCHTLITKALGPGGEVVGELPEQVMYLEWRHSAFVAEQRTCQSCHMPVVEQKTPIASVLGEPREGLARHEFVGGNAFMLRMLARYRDELGVVALPSELESTARKTVDNLRNATATVSIDSLGVASGRLTAEVTVRNLTGHKLPTGYPSRRAWLHVRVRDARGEPVFESGAIAPTGAVQGNDADADAGAFEPHYQEIRRPDEVQIYESVMGDRAGRPTTGLLQGVRYLKDNRLLPRGFDKSTAASQIAVVGSASTDGDFLAGVDRTRYVLDVTGRQGPFTIDVELRFQSIGFRWAQNLKPYNAPEPQRFVRYYESMSASSSEMLARATAASP